MSMPDAFIDSSVLIGLHFRHAGERAACKACLPPGCIPVSSQYIAFEIARGFLRSLLVLHNRSFEFKSFSDFHAHAHTGQNMFKLYQMHTWLGAMTDFMAALEQENVVIAESEKLELFRANLRVIIQRGWKQLFKCCRLIDVIGCQKHLPQPVLNSEGLITHALPVADCGKPNACGVQAFVSQRNGTVQNLIQHLSMLPKKKKGKDTDSKHVPGLQHLLTSTIGEAFDGKKCHQCGDALICLEAPTGLVIATKNARDFRPLAEFLNKPLTVAISATSTVAPCSGPSKGDQFPRLKSFWQGAVRIAKKYLCRKHLPP
jgi:hypothetical protein